MYKATILVLLFALLLGCGAKKESAENPKSVKQTPEFLPTADSTLTFRQVSRWKQCNPLLDSLAYFYSDSFKTEDPVLKLRYEEDFMKAQKKVCKLAGFPGGYKEYSWVTGCLGNSRNKHILDSLGIETH
ncbi:MAG: hypothetical protein ACLFQB_10260 [Chitinispirillaceae bacterium]